MAKYIQLLGYSTGTGTTFAAMTGSPVSPLTDGRLIGLLIVLSRAANTSIVWGGEILLKCVSFGGVECQVGFNGIGEAAADIVESALPVQKVDDIDLRVLTTSAITIEYRYHVTPTTPQLYVYGIIEG